MGALILLALGLGAFVAVGASAEKPRADSGGGGSGPPPVPPVQQQLTCDQAIAMIPAELQPLVRGALATGMDRSALILLAQQLQRGAFDNATPPQVQVALMKAAQCVQERASVLPTTPGTIPTTPGGPTASQPFYGGGYQDRNPLGPPRGG